MISAGRLRHLITVQSSTSSGDSYNQPRLTWSDAPSPGATFRAEVRPLSGREAADAKQVSAEATHQVTMRHPGFKITPKHRVLFDGRKFNIKSALNVGERDVEWRLLCQEALGPAGG